jgi:hypothetical protein
MTRLIIEVEEDIKSPITEQVLNDFEELIASKYDLTFYDSYYEWEEA